MEKEKSIEELERESIELQNKINKEMEKMVNDSKKADMVFRVIQIFLLIMLVISMVAVINQIRIDNHILETYDSCVDINNERYCRIDE